MKKIVLTTSSVGNKSILNINNSKNNLVATKYGQEKQAIPQSISISSTNNTCVDGFNLLKSLSQKEFNQYSSDYNKISQNHNFLLTYKNIMDNDSKSILSMTLNKKLDTLCSRVEYSGFIGVKDKLKSLSSI